MFIELNAARRQSLFGAATQRIGIAGILYNDVALASAIDFEGLLEDGSG
jgi:hypothetical protein